MLEIRNFANGMVYVCHCLGEEVSNMENSYVTSWVQLSHPVYFILFSIFVRIRAFHFLYQLFERSCW